MQDALYDFTRDIYEKGEVPDDYCNSIIVTILKKQRANTCDQFRKLSLRVHKKFLQKLLIDV